MNVVPCPGFAVDIDEAVVLLDDAVHRGQAQAGAFAHPFGREERLEEWASVSLSMPQPSSLTASSHILPGHEIRVIGAVVLVDAACFPSRW